MRLRSWQQPRRDGYAVICEQCNHVHLGEEKCFNSEHRGHLCGCTGTSDSVVNLCERSDSMAKDNGKSDGFTEIEGKRPKGRPKKGARIAGPPARQVRSGHLPGMEPKVMPKLHRLIEEYVAVRDERMALTEREVDLKNRLRETMKEAEIDSYKVDGHEAYLKTEETVKARLAAEGAEEAEERELRGGAPRVRGSRGAEADA